jgi:hypothetical protein
MTKEPYVDAAKAAEFLDIPIRYLTDLARAGRLPGHPLSMGTKRNVWRFRLSEIEQSISKTGATFTEPTDRRNDQSRHILNNKNGR